MKTYAEAKCYDNKWYCEIHEGMVTRLWQLAPHKDQAEAEFYANWYNKIHSHQ